MNTKENKGTYIQEKDDISGNKEEMEFKEIAKVN